MESVGILRKDRGLTKFLHPVSHLIVFLGCVSGLSAATVTVCNEAGLRSALAGGGTVVFACDGTIPLSNTLTIARNTVLDGNGHSVTISGNNAVRVFLVNTGVSFTLQNLTVANGRVVGTNGAVVGAPGEDAAGAGIFNNGTLTILNCSLQNHLTRGGNGGLETNSLSQPPGPGGHARGGAIYNNGGTISCSNSMFISNLAAGGSAGGTVGFGGGPAAGGHGFGAAVFCQSGAFAFSRTKFSGNQSLGGDASGVFSSYRGLAGSALGGALCSLGATGTVSETEFIANKVTGATIIWTGDGSGAGIGGAMYLSNGLATISRSLLASNVAFSGANYRFGGKAPARGGAIANFGSLTLIESLIEANSAVATNSGSEGPHGYGGAIDNSGRLSVLGCTLSFNTVRGGNGGNAGLGSYPAGNGYGGAIHNTGTFAVTNSTFVHNLAGGGDRLYLPPGPVGTGNGGAIATFGSMSASHVTVAGNAATNGMGPFGVSSNLISLGGGIYASNNAPVLQNAILANNFAGSNSFGALIDQGNNLSSDNSCHFTAPGSLNNTDPRLGPLDDYGGPTPTMALLGGSPAIDAGLAANCVATDQRGVARPFGAGCDIGAFESAPPYTVRGWIYGYKPGTGIDVTAGSASATSDRNGRYIVFGVSPGTHTVVPSSPEVVCIPNNRQVGVSADVLDIDFKAYRVNALTEDGYVNQIMTVVYAGASGQVVEILKAPAIDAPWSPFSTNIVEANGIFTLQISNSLARSMEFFRARRQQ
jgi:hypothetical protein